MTSTRILHNYIIYIINKILIIPLPTSHPIYTLTTIQRIEAITTKNHIIAKTALDARNITTRNIVNT